MSWAEYRMVKKYLHYVINEIYLCSVRFLLHPVGLAMVQEVSIGLFIAEAGV
jgi:hypothetical protein